MVIKMCGKCKGFDCFRNKALHVGIGILVAVIIAVAYLLWLFVSGNDELFGTDEAAVPSSTIIIDDTLNSTDHVGIIASAESVTLRKPLYIGIMTMERYINSRAAMCNRTWGQNAAISKLEFFASLPYNHDSSTHPGVINLPG